jgi:methylmalonyl-CoA mutase cobalamin-binding subunit
VSVGEFLAEFQQLVDTLKKRGVSENDITVGPALVGRDEDDDESMALTIHYSREETEQERAEREHRERRAARFVERSERTTYERLKAKFEGKSDV